MGGTRNPVGPVDLGQTTTDVTQRRGDGGTGSGALVEIGEFIDDIELYRSLHEMYTKRPDDGELRMVGPVWTLVLDDAQTRRLQATITSSTGVIASAGTVAAPIIAASVGAALAWIEIVNAIGGYHGVEITGVLGTQGVIVVPRSRGGVFDEMVRGARLGVAAVTVLDWLIAAAARSAQFATLTQLAPVASVASALALGVPFGIALGAAAALVGAIFGGGDDPHDHGEVTADRHQVGPWESFRIGHLGGGHVSLLSHMGLFCAEGGGGGGVWANRAAVGEWEKWTLLRHGDGTVSLRTVNGHHLCAETGGGRECQANRLQIGEWERFHLEPLAGGRFALRTVRTGHYVSVQP